MSGITIAAENYPGMNVASGVSGKRIVTYLNYGASATEEAPVWTLLGGVSSNTLSISANTSESQTKDKGYWSESVITSKSAEYSADMILKRDNVAQLAIEEFLLNDDITAAKQALMIAVVDLDTKEYTKMWIVPTSWEMTAGSEEFVQYSLSATVTGKPEKCSDFAA